MALSFELLVHGEDKNLATLAGAYFEINALPVGSKIIVSNCTAPSSGTGSANKIRGPEIRRLRIQAELLRSFPSESSLSLVVDPGRELELRRGVLHGCLPLLRRPGELQHRPRPTFSPLLL